MKRSIFLLALTFLLTGSIAAFAADNCNSPADEPLALTAEPLMSTEAGTDDALSTPESEMNQLVFPDRTTCGSCGSDVCDGRLVGATCVTAGGTGTCWQPTGSFCIGPLAVCHCTSDI